MWQRHPRPDSTLPICFLEALWGSMPVIRYLVFGEGGIGPVEFVRKGPAFRGLGKHADADALVSTHGAERLVTHGGGVGVDKGHRATRFVGVPHRRVVRRRDLLETVVADVELDSSSARRGEDGGDIGGRYVEGDRQFTFALRGAVPPVELPCRPE